MGDGIEGLWIVKFGMPALWGAGVIVLESQRFFGGDSAYYYVGDYGIEGAKITAHGRIARHTLVPGLTSIFGDWDDFNVTLIGTVSEGHISGVMQRQGVLIPPVPVVLDFKTILPNPS